MYKVCIAKSDLSSDDKASLVKGNEIVAHKIQTVFSIPQVVQVIK